MLRSKNRLQRWIGISRFAVPMSLALVVAGTASEAGANTPPTISTIPSQTMSMGGTQAINFTIGDAETPGSLTVTGDSNNQDLLPDVKVELSGSGTSRTVTLKPLNGKFGVATVHITVNDGSGLSNATAETSFPVTVNPGNEGAINITSLSPASGAEGDAITINGTGLMGPEGADFQNDVKIWFKNYNGDWTFVSPDGGSTSTSLLATAPFGVRTGLLAVEVNSLNTVDSTTSHFLATSNFTVNAVITSFSPRLGQAPQEVTINGTGFTNVTQVSFNGVSTPVLSSYESFVTVDVPAGATTGKISVATSDAGTAVSAIDFVVGTNVAPTISQVSPQATAMGAAKTINFTVGDTETPAASLDVSAVSGNQGLVPNENIVVGGSGTNRTVTVTPTTEQFGALNIYLTVNDGSGAVNEATGMNFRLTVNPGNTGGATITGFTPSSGKVDDLVTITGTGLFVPPADGFLNGTTVWFKSYTGDWMSVGVEPDSTDTALKVKVPVGARSGPLTAEVNTYNLNSGDATRKLATSAANFTVNAVIDSFSPTQGEAGASVDIVGNGFTNATQVLFNGVSGEITAGTLGESFLTAKVPHGASTGIISVVTPDAGTAVSSTSFTFVINDPAAPVGAVVTAPANNGLITNLNGGFHGTAQDDAAGSGIIRVDVELRRFSNDAYEFWGFNGTTSTWEWSTTPRSLTAILVTPLAISTAWNLTANLPSGANLPNGQYLAHAIAYDRAGNSFVGADNTFNVNNDSVAPTISVTTPANGLVFR